MRLSKSWCLWAGWVAPLAAVWAGDLRITEEKGAVRVATSYLDLKVSLVQPAILSLAVDSLGLGKGGPDSSRSPAVPSPLYRAWCRPGDSLKVEYFRPDAAGMANPGWRFEVSEKSIRMVSRFSEAEKPENIVLEFDPHRCHVTLLGMLNSNGSVRLPAVMHFPDQGSFRIAAVGIDAAGAVEAESSGAKRSEKDPALGYDARRAGAGYVKVTFPAATAERRRVEYRWEVVTIHPPLGEKERDPRFNGFRRNWLNILQLNPRLRVLANHAASDTCAFCLYEYADIARATPPLAENLTALDLIRQSLDRYLEGLAGYGLPGNVMFDAPGQPSTDPPYLDSYPSLLIAATEYVAGSGDKAWLEQRYSGLKTWADKLLAMDHDGNGLFEYPYSGNSGSWSGKGEKRPSNWWDTIGFGHEDAYANALAYRALRGMESMAGRLGKAGEADRYRAAADKLRAAYANVFYNPATGVLAGWRSADGQLHDYHFLFVNGIAIHYGLLPT